MVKKGVSRPHGQATPSGSAVSRRPSHHLFNKPITQKENQKLNQIRYPENLFYLWPTQYLSRLYRFFPRSFLSSLFFPFLSSLFPFLTSSTASATRPRTLPPRPNKACESTSCPCSCTTRHQISCKPRKPSRRRPAARPTAASATSSRSCTIPRSRGPPPSRHPCVPGKCPCRSS